MFGVVGLAGLVIAADDPKADDDAPVRLKKKNKQPTPPPVQPKDEKPKDEKPKDEKAKDDIPKDVDRGPGAKEDEKEVLERISRNMKAVEDRLINKELNESTRQLKDDIIKDIDSLIKMAENLPPSDGGGSGGSPPPSGNSKDVGSESQSKPDSKPMDKGGMDKGGMDKGGMDKGGKNHEPMGSREGEGTPGHGVTTDKNPPKPPSLDDEKGKWGHLPEALRAQMNAYATREEYMAKHQELIKEYYRNLAKQGRNKKD